MKTDVCRFLSRSFAVALLAVGSLHSTVERAAASATIVDNVVATVPGFTTVGTNGAAQAFTGGGRAGALMTVTLKLRVSPNVALDTFIVGTGPTVIQGKQVQVEIFDGATWVSLGGVILQRAFLGDTTFNDQLFANIGGGPLSSFSVGGSATMIRVKTVKSDGVDWAWGAATNRAFSAAEGTFGTARTNAASGAETVLTGTTFQMSATRDNSGDSVPPTITLFNPANVLNDPTRKAEGSGASTPFVFTVQRTGDLTGPSSVSWTVSGATFFVPDAAVAGDFVGGVFPSGVLNFSANESAKDITVLVNGDFDVEPDKGFRVRLSSTVGAVLDATFEAYGVINNDDQLAQLDIAATDVDKAEGNSGATPFTFTVTRSVNVGSAVQVQWAVSFVGFPFVDVNDFFPQGLPYTNGTVAFAANETTKTIVVNVAGDTVPEPDKQFKVTLANPSAGAVLGTDSATGTIRDDHVNFSIAPNLANRSEGNSGPKPFTFVIHRSAQGSQVVNATASVDWAVSGSASSGAVSPAVAADFTGNVLTNGAVTFSGGAADIEISVLVAGNTTIQADREFTVTLSNPSAGATITTATALGTIRDDDANPAIIDTLGSPNTDTIDFFPGAEHRDIAFTTDNQAYQLSAVVVAFLSFADAMVQFDLRSDAGGAPGALIESWSANVPIGAPLVTNVSVTLAMLQANTKYWLVVTPPANDHALAASAQADNTGTGVLDGVTPAPLTPGLLPLFAVRGLSGASLVASFAVAATSATKPEGNPGSSTPFTFTITRSGVLTNANSVDWAVTGTGARPANAADFVGGLLPQGTVNFASNETTKVITVNVAGDNLAELDETFTVTLSNPSNNALIGVASAVGTILGDDSELRLEAVNADRPEGAGQFQFQVRRNGATNGTTTVNWGVAGGAITPADAADFGGAFPSGTVTFNPGDTVQQINVNVADDSTVEPDETFVVTLSNPSAGARIIVGSAGGVIRNDDTSVRIGPLDADKAEGNSGATPFTFLLTRRGVLTGSTTVNYAVNGSGGNPAAGDDFVGGAFPSGTVTFNAGQAAFTLSINVNGDTAVESDESFVVTISNATGGATIENSTASGTIRNDDLGAPVGTLIVSSFTNATTGGFDGVIGPETQSQSFTNGPNDFVLGSVSMRLALTNNAFPNITADILLLADDGASATDMFSGITRATPGTVLATIGTVQITKVFDGSVNPLTAAALASYEVNIPAISNVTLKANTTYWVGVHPTSPANGGIAVLSWVDGNPVQGVGTMGSLGANLYNDNPTGTGFLLGGSYLAVTAAAPPPSGTTLAIAANNADQPEGNSGVTAFTFTITRAGVTSGSTTVNWAVAGGAVNPADAADFQGNAFPSGAAIFADGETIKIITVNVGGDSVVEPDEEFVVTLSGATGGAQIVVPAATGVIRNDDTAFAVVATDADKPEGTSAGTIPFVFTVIRSGRLDAAQSINWSVAGSGTFPANANDFSGGALPSGTVNFAPGESAKTISVLVNADGDNERDETFTVTLSGAPAGTIITTATAVGTIRNDDPLAITTTGGNLQIVWGNVGAVSGYVLESTDTLNPPNWVVVAQVPDIGDGQASTTLPLQGSGKFFRLRKLP